MVIVHVRWVLWRLCYTAPCCCSCCADCCTPVYASASVLSAVCRDNGTGSPGAHNACVWLLHIYGHCNHDCHSQVSSLPSAQVLQPLSHSQDVHAQHVASSICSCNPPPFALVTSPGFDLMPLDAMHEVLHAAATSRTEKRLLPCSGVADKLRVRDVSGAERALSAALVTSIVLGVAILCILQVSRNGVGYSLVSLSRHRHVL